VGIERPDQGNSNGSAGPEHGRLPLALNGSNRVPYLEFDTNDDQGPLHVPAVPLSCPEPS